LAAIGRPFFSTTVVLFFFSFAFVSKKIAAVSGGGGRKASPKGCGLAEIWVSFPSRKREKERDARAFFSKKKAIRDTCFFGPAQQEGCRGMMG